GSSSGTSFAVPSAQSVGPCTPMVFMPSPSSVKEMASDDSAMPYEGSSARLSKPMRSNDSANPSSVSGRMGSAPHPATRHVERSSPSRSAGLMRLTQRAYAKFGAYAM